MRYGLSVFLAVVSASLWTSVAAANNVYITEFSSNSGDLLKYEYVEFTNMGSTPVNMAGWSEDDSNRRPNRATHTLDGFGTLAPRESAILTEADPNAFRIYWWGSVAASPANLKIIGPYTNDNLSSSGDEINLYDNTYTNPPYDGLLGSSADTSTDRLTYNPDPNPNDPNSGGTGIAASRNVPFAYLGLNENPNLVVSSVGDSFRSWHAFGEPGTPTDAIGSPGFYANPVLADLNNDWRVDISDVQLVAQSLPTQSPKGDANGDGIVDISDIQAIAQHWSGNGGGAGVSVPEPSTAVSLIAGLPFLALAFRRRRQVAHSNDNR